MDDGQTRERQGPATGGSADLKRCALDWQANQRSPSGAFSGSYCEQMLNIHNGHLQSSDP